MAKQRRARRTRTEPRSAPIDPELLAQRELRRGMLADKIVTQVGMILMILASSAPLYLIYRSIDALAGKSTYASFGLTITIAGAGLGALIKAFSDRSKMKAQAAELKRLRERCEALEKNAKVKLD